MYIFSRLYMLLLLRILDESHLKINNSAVVDFELFILNL